MGRGLERDSNWVGVVVVVEMVVGMAVSLFEKRPIFQVFSVLLSGYIFRIRFSLFYQVHTSTRYQYSTENTS